MVDNFMGGKVATQHFLHHQPMLVHVGSSARGVRVVRGQHPHVAVVVNIPAIPPVAVARTTAKAGLNPIADSPQANRGVGAAKAATGFVQGQVKVKKHVPKGLFVNMKRSTPVRLVSHCYLLITLPSRL